MGYSTLSRTVEDACPYKLSIFLPNTSQISPTNTATVYIFISIESFWAACKNLVLATERSGVVSIKAAEGYGGKQPPKQKRKESL